ncbi:MAG: hypothetical protein ABI589_06270 [Burkholderiales bacterium]
MLARSDRSSSAVLAGAERRAPAGNTDQSRVLGAGGSSHRIVKNSPTGPELEALVAALGEQAIVTTWPFYWAMEYVASPG